MNKDSYGRSYTDTGTLTAGSVNDIGKYTVTIVTYQDIDDPTNGYFDPIRGVIP